MDYQRIYSQLIERAKARVPHGYVERHHIVPRCLGGSDDTENLVALYPEEHFFAHELLVKMHPSEPKLIFALNKMTMSSRCTRRGRRKLYGWLRLKFVAAIKEASTGKGNSQYGSRWITNGTESKKIRKDELIPEGWQLGRKASYHREKTWTKSVCKVCRTTIDTGTHRRNYCDEHLKERLKAPRGRK